MYKKINGRMSPEELERQVTKDNIIDAVNCLDNDPEHIVIKYNNGHWHVRTDNYEAAGDTLSELLIDWLIENSF